MKTRTKTLLHCAMILIAGILFSTCSGEKKAAEILEIAAFEEVQFNTEHATELYQKIIEKYPETEAASKARIALERLSKKPEDE